MYSPPLNLAKVESDGPVGERLLIEVFGVAPDERRHIIACVTLSLQTNVNLFYFFNIIIHEKILQVVNGRRGNFIKHLRCRDSEWN